MADNGVLGKSEKSFTSYFDANKAPGHKIKIGKKKAIAVVFFIFGILVGVALGSYGTTTGNAVFTTMGNNLKAFSDGFVTLFTSPFAIFNNNNNDIVGNPVAVDMYVMSMCPYGVQAEDGIFPTLEKFGNSVKLNVYFIGDGVPGSFSSLHGQKEVDEDMRQVCIIEHYPERYYDYLSCINDNYSNAAANWEACAASVGIDSQIISACFDSTEGGELLSASFAKSSQIGASGSPTIYLAGKSYSGGRTDSAFTREICKSLSNHPACAGVETPAEVKMIVINDERCGQNCDVSSLISSLESQVFSNLKVEELDYNSARGKELYNANGLTLLPAFLFEASVASAEGYDMISNYIEVKGAYKSLKIGSSFDPTKEICDNEIDDTDNGLVDCDDLDCTADMACREEVIGKVDLFVMSQCPYGTMAETSLVEIMDALGDQIDVDVHFIASYNEATGAFSSLHGQKEVAEDMRQVCLMKYANSTSQYTDYLTCANANYQTIDTVWTGCAEDAGFDTAVISECYDTEGSDLLISNIELSNDLAIGGSPTWLLNNNQIAQGYSAKSILTAICALNADFTGCDAEVSGDTTAPAGGCG